MHLQVLLLLRLCVRVASLAGFPRQEMIVEIVLDQSVDQADIWETPCHADAHEVRAMVMLIARSSSFVRAK